MLDALQPFERQDLTIARLVVIPVYAILIMTSVHGHSWAAAILFGVAAITDQVDGFLARRWHVESAFGKIASLWNSYKTQCAAASKSYT